jgi:hypothetical protein
MTCKQLALSALALAITSLPATAETEFRQISPSIILLGGPEPADPLAEKKRGRTTDVLAGGERRVGGVVTPVAASAAVEPPVAENEKTSAPRPEKRRGRKNSPRRP